MISQAIKERYPGALFIKSDLQSIRFTDPRRKKRFVYLTPPIAQLALVKYDLGAKIKPFEFRVDSPAQTLPMNSRKPARTEHRRKLEGRVRRRAKKRAKAQGAKRVRLHQREREFGLGLLDKQAI